MIEPSVSAGSSQRGASVKCTAHVIWPAGSGAADCAIPAGAGPSANAITTSVPTSRRMEPLPGRRGADDNDAFRPCKPGGNALAARSVASERGGERDALPEDRIAAAGGDIRRPGLHPARPGGRRRAPPSSPSLVKSALVIAGGDARRSGQ